MDSSTFVDVIVILNDGDQILMVRCIKCDFVLQKKKSLQKCHKTLFCGSKWCFRYMHEQRDRPETSAKCMICQEKFTSPSVEDLKLHYGSRHYNSSQPTTIATSKRMEYIHENSVNTIPANYRLPFCYTMGLSFKRVYVFTENKFKEFGECSGCKTLIEAKHQFVLHRRECPLPTQMLISVSTQTNSTSNSAVFEKKCLICKTKSSESFVDLYDAMSIASNTPIYILLCQISNTEAIDELTSIASPQFRFLCAKCLDTINRYESFCMKAARLEDEIRFELYRTESLFERDQRIRDGNEERSIDGMFSGGAPSTEGVNGIHPAESGECRTIVLSDDDEPDVILID